MDDAKGNSLSCLIMERKLSTRSFVVNSPAASVKNQFWIAWAREAMIEMMKNLVITKFNIHQTSDQVTRYLPQSIHVAIVAPYSGVGLREPGNCLGCDTLDVH